MKHNFAFFIIAAFGFTNTTTLFSQETEPTEKAVEQETVEHETVEHENPTPEEPTSSSLLQRWAVGTNFAWQTRRDYGARDYRRFSPEIVGYLYGELPYEEFFWRAGTRIGYASDQPEMPQAVRFEETDTTWLMEVGIIKEWYVTPSLSFGFGYDFRTTKVKVDSPVDSVDERLNRKERLAMSYIQTGLGLPILKGMFLIEPLIRYHSIDYDDRSHWTFGVEWTVGF